MISSGTPITSTSTQSNMAHVGRAEDWPYSSFHRMVRLGIYPADWAGEFDEKEEIGFGER